MSRFKFNHHRTFEQHFELLPYSFQLPWTYLESTFLLSSFFLPSFYLLPTHHFAFTKRIFRVINVPYKSMVLTTEKCKITKAKKEDLIDTRIFLFCSNNFETNYLFNFFNAASSLSCEIPTYPTPSFSFCPSVRTYFKKATTTGLVGTPLVTR